MTTETPVLFNKGRVVISRKIHLWSVDNPEHFHAISAGLVCHVRGDWGILEPEDVLTNKLAISQGYGVILGVYECDGRTFWIYTEPDWSVTTILFPEER
jgi:hypothetical protein